METDIFSIHLFASSGIDWAFWYIVLKVAFVLGLIIFVHELGHFLVAKACGVRCDKFYIGFDFFGLKFLKFKWGETEYGIGVFPLGGYVKMLGQEDNPGELRDRLEKAKQARSVLEKSGEERGEKTLDGEHVFSDEEIAEMERLINDPRSYQSKSVPQRMAIITAGVIMNTIFAFVAAVIAFMLGTYKTPAEITDVYAGQAAWEAGLRSGDKILSISDHPVQYFDQIQKYIMLGDDLEKGVKLIYRRPSLEADQLALVYPRKLWLAPMLGATHGGSEMQLFEQSPCGILSPAWEASEKAKGALKLLGGERILQVNGIPVKNYLDFQLACYQGQGEPLTVKFCRSKKEESESQENARNQVVSEGVVPELPLEIPEKAEMPEEGYVFDLVILPQKLRHFGVTFDMGPVHMTQITAEGPGPARQAGILPGDTLIGMEVDGKMEFIGDPMTLPYRIFELAKKQDTVTFNVRRGEKTDLLNISADATSASETLEGAKEERITVKLNRFPVPPSENHFSGTGLAIPEIGLSFFPSMKIAEVHPGSEAEKSGLKRGDILRGITFNYTKDFDETGKTPEEKKYYEEIQKTFKKPFSPPLKQGNSSLSYLWDFIQRYPLDGTELTLIVERKDSLGHVKKHEAQVHLKEYEDVYAWGAGFNLKSKPGILVKADLGEALVLGAEETGNALMLVYRTLGKLIDGQVSIRGLGGPILIAQAAYNQAKEGWATLLMFVCLISANLAVMNLLPIPVLDGGHVVFLLYEGITGKAPNENLVIALTYAGLLLFLVLTFFVFALDLGFIARF
ncbi:MAG: site-2 protease family protein [Planctomycetia bacterium]|nr:site-2 protease family protein [Planctomycetia bacterium]